jgi:hypothetical protein
MIHKDAKLISKIQNKTSLNLQNIIQVEIYLKMYLGPRTSYF